MNNDNAMLVQDNVGSALKCAAQNYRTWLLSLTFAYTCGVETIVGGVIAAYVHEEFGTSLMTSVLLTATFGVIKEYIPASGGKLSDQIAIRFGMRGRLWLLWTILSLSGAICMVLAVITHSPGTTITIMIILFMLCQQAYGAHYRIVPFISHRCRHLLSGAVVFIGDALLIVGLPTFFAGLLGFQYSPGMSRQDGLFWMGVMTLGMATFVSLYHFPQWGSMLFPRNPDYTEVDYYLTEWSAEEVAMGLHNSSMIFAVESRCERGLMAAPVPGVPAPPAALQG